MIDYSKYSTDELLDIQKNIDKQSPNYPAFLAELENRKDTIAANQAQNERKEYDLNKLKIKVVGYFQLVSAFVLIALIIYHTSAGNGVSLVAIGIALPLIFLNCIAGITAVKHISKWYWVSVLNQCLQLLSFNIGSYSINYAGLGYMNIILGWGEEFSLGFDMQFSPGFNFYKYTETLAIQSVGVDVFAILFILAFMHVKEFERRS